MFESESVLYGLAIACPLHNCDHSCPIDQIRDMPIRDRLIYLGTLNNEEKAELIERHNKCIQEFEAKYFHTIGK